jgi:hypothetical protein
MDIGWIDGKTTIHGDIKGVLEGGGDFKGLVYGMNLELVTEDIIIVLYEPVLGVDISGRYGA